LAQCKRKKEVAKTKFFQLPVNGTEVAYNKISFEKQPHREHSKHSSN
jgi:hypothetical protein